MIEYRVIIHRKPSYKNPMILHENDKVECGEEYRENENWPGWTWCKTENDAGWVPKQIIERNGDQGVVSESYDGTEFDIQVDEIIIMEKMLNGWIWGHKRDNAHKKAWVPLDHLEEVRTIS